MPTGAVQTDTRSEGVHSGQMRDAGEPLAQEFDVHPEASRIRRLRRREFYGLTTASAVMAAIGAWIVAIPPRGITPYFLWPCAIALWVVAILVVRTSYQGAQTRPLVSVTVTPDTLDLKFFGGESTRLLWSDPASS